MPRRLIAIKADPKTFTLSLTWANKTAVDLSRTVTRGGVFAQLADPKVFARARLVHGGHGVGWPGTDADCAADALWFAAYPPDNVHPDQVMTAAEFRGWMRLNGYSLQSAADALGLSRRTVAYYATGQRPIPKVVFLACMTAGRIRQPERLRAA